MSNVLYLEIESVLDSSGGNGGKGGNVLTVRAPLQTVLTLCVYKYCNVPNIKVVYVICHDCCGEFVFEVECESDASDECVIEHSSADWLARACRLPAVLQSDRFLAVGTAAVARKLVILGPIPQRAHIHPDGLLGFRAGCLQAPNETSVWTKFCEIEIVRTTTAFVRAIGRSNYDGPLPDDVARFEYHLGRPVRVHNVYKLARDIHKLSVQQNTQNIKEQKDPESDRAPRTNAKSRKWKSKNNHIIDSSTPIDLLGLSHAYAEGPHFTLADLLLYPCFYFLFSHSDPERLKELAPLTLRWTEDVRRSDQFGEISSFLDSISIFKEIVPPVVNYTRVPNVEKVSLYKCDPKRTTKKKKMFTKEEDIESALTFIDDSNLEYAMQSVDSKIAIDWKNIPLDAQPLGGHLPQDRMHRKTQQLENLADATMKIAKDGDKIVDFCSGGGHLGILLACLLPKCTIILLENKDESLKRARARVARLGLTNVYFFQSNLDFFIGDFDVGVALHACGVSTDLVLDNCVRKKASFVICPCCYGSLHQTDRLKYPRSREYGNMTMEQYLCIGHAADQTHADHPMEQRGSRCMKIIDRDRALQAEGCGYTVTLSRLIPLSCTPKNMIIVGVPSIK